jgi:hypothetical protein
MEGTEDAQSAISWLMADESIERVPVALSENARSGAALVEVTVVDRDSGRPLAASGSLCGILEG